MNADASTSTSKFEFQLPQQPPLRRFQAPSLEGSRISELCPPGVIATPGQQKRRAEPLLTESVLNPYVLIPLPYRSFNHHQFVEEEAENFTPLTKIKRVLTYHGVIFGKCFTTASSAHIKLYIENLR